MKSRQKFKIFLLLVKLIIQVLGSSSSSSPSQLELRSEFKKFTEKFDKSYSNKFDEYTARKNFGINLMKIQQHNEAYERGEVTFQLDINSFADQDVKAMERMVTNTAPPTPLLMGRAVGVLNEARFPPGPPSIDWRDSGCITPVKDQSYYCNSCYAFSGMAALEAQWCLKTGRYVTLSEQQILDCSFNRIYGNWACDGGSQATAYVYISRAGGVESDVTYPFNYSTPDTRRQPCRFNRNRVVATASGYWRIRPFRERQLANVIALVGPVSASMNAAVETFWYYSSGVYSDVECVPSTSHSVLIVGYGTDDSVDPPMDYWICKNSWSAEWGDGGYFKIQRGVNMCGISGFLIFPEIPTANITQTTTTAAPYIT